MRDLVQLVETLAGAPVTIDRQPAAPGDVTRTGGATAAARALLGWSPIVALDEGLQRQLDWHRFR
jgi:nucleoside-diphosphate-sugar epimerase